MPSQPNGATRVFPIIGDPIRYVESPQRLTRTFERRGANALCVPMQVPSDDLDTVMAGLSACPNVDGLLVTMPHKLRAFSCCGTTSERAGQLMAISVMRRNVDGSWHGDMLDGVAFVTAQQRRGAQVAGARALLVGAGGAGRAIAIELVRAGVRDVVVNDVDESRIASLLELLPAGGHSRAQDGSADPSGCDLVFNATPLGMEEGDPLPLDTALLDSSMFVGDVIAGHGVTPLVRAARGAGCLTATGDDMVDAVQDVMADFLLGETP